MVKVAKGGHRVFIEKFVWDPVGYKQMQFQPAIQTYMRARAEVIEQEMKRLLSGPARSAQDYRDHSRYSNAYPIGTSTNYRLRKSIKTQGPKATGIPDSPYSFNVGPEDYNPNRGDPEAIIGALREGRSDNRMQGRDFIKQAIRNALGVSV